MFSFINGPGGALSAIVRQLVYFSTENARHATNEWQDLPSFQLTLDWKDACELVNTHWTSLTGREKKEYMCHIMVIINIKDYPIH
jgi:hypothetical protein